MKLKGLNFFIVFTVSSELFETKIAPLGFSGTVRENCPALFSEIYFPLLFFPCVQLGQYKSVKGPLQVFRRCATFEKMSPIWFFDVFSYRKAFSSHKKLPLVF